MAGVARSESRWKRGKCLKHYLPGFQETQKPQLVEVEAFKMVYPARFELTTYCSGGCLFRQ